MKYEDVLIEIAGIAAMTLSVLIGVYLLASVIYYAKYSAKLDYMEKLNKLSKTNV